MAVMFSRDLWAPDEPDFAQCVREMRERGSWLLPYLNGLPYSEKPILFYWMMKLSAVIGDHLTGGAGFTHGVAAWALRIPSVMGSLVFLFAFRKWAKRFLQHDVADIATLILCSTPLWFWQSQFIQIDLIFSAMLAWSWLCWQAGYLLLRGYSAGSKDEHRGRFHAAYLWLGLATLAKGPLAIVLSVPLLLIFLAWQNDLKALKTISLSKGIAMVLLVVLPWFGLAAWRGGSDFAYELLILQNLERATQAWDHLQPWWKYGQYLLGDFFPWVLLLPSLALFLRRSGIHRTPAIRFFMLAFLVPLLFLSWSQSKQGKYLLVAYPFLSLLLAQMLQSLCTEGSALSRMRRIGGILALGLWLPALTLVAVGFFHAGGSNLQVQVLPILGALRLCGGVLLLGAISVTSRALLGQGTCLVRDTAATLGLLFFLGGTWGFYRLDPVKNYHRWTAEATPLLNGRRVYFWQTVRSGAMVYTDHLMPELRTFEELEGVLGPNDRLVSMDREWGQDAWGMNPERRRKFEVILRVPIGDREILLIRKQSTQLHP
jgi:4-amino-4-deoxy-L-arabinose transferase-like glycosyltransferase